MKIRHGPQLGLALLMALAGCTRASGGTDTTTTSPTARSEPTASPTNIATTENGEAAAEPYSILDGEVTFSAAPPWEVGFAGPWALWLDDNIDERVHVLADPLPIEAGCRKGPVPADAEALGRSIRSDPDLEATEPVAVGVRGIQALRMDVVAATGASVCPDWEGPGVVKEAGLEERDDTVVLGGGHRMRLYLLNLPGGSARILAIAIVAPEQRFERVVEAAASILDSFEFRTK